jgi:hypothetical protein
MGKLFDSRGGLGLRNQASYEMLLGKNRVLNEFNCFVILKVLLHTRVVVVIHALFRYHFTIQSAFKD